MGAGVWMKRGEPRTGARGRGAGAIAVLLGLAVASGCAEEECQAPAVLSYSCDPTTSMGDVCRGGPMTNDPSLSFPLGCIAMFPFCGTLFPDTAYTCECVRDGDDEPPDWRCTP